MKTERRLRKEDFGIEQISDVLECFVDFSSKKRNSVNTWSHSFEHGNLHFDQDQRMVSVCGKKIELTAKEFEATAGGGAITVKVSGSKEIKEIIIKKDVVDPEDVEMLQDLILTCTNEALRKVDAAQASSMGKYNIPGLM